MIDEHAPANREQTDQTPDSDRRVGPTFDRRRWLQALGAGAALTLGTNTVAAATRQDDSPVDRSGEDIHPVFGFSALSMDVEPPVEPDHEVRALIQPREDREIPEFYFEPTGLFIEPGETVQFSLVSPHHSVTAYHPGMGTQQRVPDDVPPLSSPVLPVNAYWLYTFEQPGVYDLHCGPHELFGHVIRIVAGEATGPGAEPVPEPEPTPEPGEGPQMPENGPPDGMPHEDEMPHGDGMPHEDGMPHGDGMPQDSDDGPQENGDAEEEAQTPDDDPEPELRPPVGAALTVLGDVAIDPDRIVDEGQVSWDEIDDENKALVL